MSAIFRKSFLTNIPYVLISSIKTLFVIIFFLPSFISGFFEVVLSIYIHISLSNVLFIGGDPKISIISFLFDLFNVILACLFSKYLTPWCLLTLFNEQFVTRIENKII